MAVPRKFPESKKVSKENFRFPKCGNLFCRAVDRITRQFPKLLMAMPWIKSFQVYYPSSFLERRMGAHGFRADLEGHLDRNGSRCAGFTVSGGRFSPPCIQGRGPVRDRSRGRCCPRLGIV